jgi:hypothetical protein
VPREERGKIGSRSVGGPRNCGLRAAACGFQNAFPNVGGYGLQCHLIPEMLHGNAPWPNWLKHSHVPMTDYRSAAGGSNEFPRVPPVRRISNIARFESSVDGGTGAARRVAPSRFAGAQRTGNGAGGPDLPQHRAARPLNADEAVAARQLPPAFRKFRCGAGERRRTGERAAVPGKINLSIRRNELNNFGQDFGARPPSRPSQFSGKSFEPRINTDEHGCRQPLFR